MKKEEYKVLLLPSARRDLDDIKDRSILTRLKESMFKLGKEPRPYGCLKLLEEDNGYRIRVGDFRYCYRINDPEKTVYIYRVKHRKEVYR